MAEVRERSPFGRAHVVLLGLLAYVPLLLSAPGRVAGDTKLYLYLDPGRLISDSLWSWDARQLGGWVPHQNVGYLWPTGPFYAFFDWLGCPDWIAQRLWLGSLLFVAGLGARRLARLFEQPMVVAGAAAIFYQLTPYVLPYVSRTSALLLPWSLLPWLVHSVIGYARTGDRRHLGIFGLLVLSTGGLNATALFMIAPAPLIFFVHEARRRGTKYTLKGLGALSALSIAVSTWWMSGLVVQGRYGAAVLSYSEALPSTAATSTSTEVLRGLGYWLFYDRNKVVELTSAAEPYQGNPAVMLAGVAVLVLGLIGLVTWRSEFRRPVLLTLGVGTILAVGAHPFDDPSPLWRLAAEHPTSALSLALRSSTRATPLVVLALALGAARAVDLGVRRLRKQNLGTTSALITTGLALTIALVNLPALIGGRLIDPDVSRPQNLPRAWYDAADFLDRRYDEGRTGSVLLVPGVESAAYRWGYPVDPILPGLTKKPLLTRDWLPLGSAPLNDLLYALDDSFQEGRADPASIAPVARLLGADTVMVVNSVQYERFGTIRPERTAAVFGSDPPGLVEVADFGSPTVNLDPRPDASDDRAEFSPTALPEIVLYEVTDPPAAARSTSRPAIVLGDGTGTVDLAAAGIVDGRSVLLPYAAISGADRESFIDDAPWVIVTDSNRRRAHHWRGSQEVWGATEPRSGVLDRVDLFDQRLPVFPTAAIDDQTVIRSEDIEATATTYGTELRYWPEYRPSMALDGDPETAWMTSGFGTPVGQVLTIRSSDSLVDHLQIELPDSSFVDQVTRIEIRVDDTDWISVPITDAASSSTGQRVDLPRAGQHIEIRIADTTRHGSGAPLVGLAEVLPPELRRTEVVQVPPTPNGAAGKLTFVFTRLRADEFDDWRHDPEREIVREFTVPRDDTFPISFVARGLSTAGGPQPGCRTDLALLDDRPLGLRVVDAAADSTTLALCDETTELSSGTHVIQTTARATGATIDRVVIGTTPSLAPAEPLADFSASRVDRRGTISNCTETCWVEVGDGWNTGWGARIDGSNAGNPMPSLGGRNTWLVEGGTTSGNLTIHWAPQRIIWIGLVISLGAAVFCANLAARRRKSTLLPAAQPRRSGRASNRWAIAGASLMIAVAVSPAWAVIALLLVAAVHVLRPRLIRAASMSSLIVVGATLIGIALAFLFAQQIRTGAEPGFGWPSVFERGHRVLLTGLLLVIVGSWAAPDRDSVTNS